MGLRRSTFIAFGGGLAVAFLTALFVFTVVPLPSRVEGNSAAIERSCEGLNFAIVQSQKPPMPKKGERSPNAILIAAILRQAPEIVPAYKRALKHAKPYLSAIDCKRLANDPSYVPYRPDRPRKRRR